MQIVALLTQIGDTLHELKRVPVPASSVRLTEDIHEILAGTTLKALRESSLTEAVLDCMAKRPLILQACQSTRVISGKQTYIRRRAQDNSVSSQESEHLA